MAKMLQLFEQARTVSVPVLVLRTPDQNASADAIRGSAQEFVVLQWDAARGITPVLDQSDQPTPATRAALNKMFPTNQLPTGNTAESRAAIRRYAVPETLGFADAMDAMHGMPKGTVLLAHNSHRQLHASEPNALAGNVQAVANLRDVLKRDFRMLVLMGPMGMSVPSELARDSITIEHELPTGEELGKIVTEISGSAKKGSAEFEAPSNDQMPLVISAVSGLCHFEAEQQLAMSLVPTGIDLDALWERKRVAIENTRGLRVYRGKERFSDIIGLDSAKARLSQRIRGKVPIGCVLWVDEIDKVFANVEHDTTGVRTDQFMTFLTEMENNEWEGALYAGLPGGGKSLLAKAFGNEAGVPTIQLDLGGMEGSLVGESEQRIREAMAVIKAIGGGHAFIIATSNNATIMRPELQRRFTAGFFFFDLMTQAEREAAWAYYMKKYGLEPQPFPEDEGWSAAEIRNCARDAWNSNISLVEASRFVLPVAQSRASEFSDMRQYAHGKYLDATKPGPYQFDPAPMASHIRAIAVPRAAIAALEQMKES